MFFTLLLLLLSHFSCVRLCATPQTAAHQAPPSLGFSRQEHWSGLPFSSPMHESESEVTQSCPTLRDPMDCSLPQAPPSMGFSMQEYWSGLPLLSPVFSLRSAPAQGKEPLRKDLQGPLFPQAGMTLAEMFYFGPLGPGK